MLNFEEALVYELGTIEDLFQMIFPLYAPEGIVPPFVVYTSSEGEQTATLEGYMELTEIICEIHVVSFSYVEMKILTKQVIDKIQTFFNRSIGVAGPVIKSVSYEQPIEEHQKEYNYYHSAFELTVWI